MARVTFVKKARKDYPYSEIKRGDSYYWWKFRFGGKIRSKTRPARSRLTQSAFYGTLMDLEDGMDLESIEGIKSSLESAAEEVRSLGEEQTEKMTEMEQYFPNSCPVMEQLQERSDECESLADEMESLMDGGFDELDDLISEVSSLNWDIG